MAWTLQLYQSVPGVTQVGVSEYQFLIPFALMPELNLVALGIRKSATALLVRIFVDCCDNMPKFCIHFPPDDLEGKSEHSYCSAALPVERPDPCQHVQCGHQFPGSSGGQGDTYETRAMVLLFDGWQMTDPVGALPPVTSLPFPDPDTMTNIIYSFPSMRPGITYEHLINNGDGASERCQVLKGLCHTFQGMIVPTPPQDNVTISIPLKGYGNITPRSLLLLNTHIERQTQFESQLHQKCSRLGVGGTAAFHGTPPHNIFNILCDGLKQNAVTKRSLSLPECEFLSHGWANSMFQHQDMLFGVEAAKPRVFYGPEVESASYEDTVMVRHIFLLPPAESVALTALKMRPHLDPSGKSTPPLNGFDPVKMLDILDTFPSMEPGITLQDIVNCERKKGKERREVLNQIMLHKPKDDAERGNFLLMNTNAQRQAKFEGLLAVCDENIGINAAFHGTPAQNTFNILCDGLKQNSDEDGTVWYADEPYRNFKDQPLLFGLEIAGPISLSEDSNGECVQDNIMVHHLFIIPAPAKGTRRNPRGGDKVWAEQAIWPKMKEAFSRIHDGCLIRDVQMESTRQQDEGGTRGRDDNSQLEGLEE
ncbi:hypothetical protein PG994_002586 [Apiospora phragmitis]|uniref:Uncharacterized protein n=1 Tax=Apiospora phragmitis TaxID=2905665 RepID=A0ABR1W5L8_9PEZI